MTVDLAALASAFPFLMKGLWFTLQITFVGVTGGIVFGSLLAIARLSQNRLLSTLATARNFDPSIAIHSPRIRPQLRAKRMRAVPAAVTASECMRRNSEMLLWSGYKRPRSHISSMFRRHSASKRRDERI